MNFRIFFNLILFCLLPLVPWWLVALVILIGIFRFFNYWEALAFSFLYDLAFGLPSGWLETQFTFTIVFSVVYLLVEGTRDSFNFSWN